MFRSSSSSCCCVCPLMFILRLRPHSHAFCIFWRIRTPPASMNASEAAIRHATTPQLASSNIEFDNIHYQYSITVTLHPYFVEVWDTTDTIRDSWPLHPNTRQIKVPTVLSLVAEPWNCFYNPRVLAGPFDSLKVRYSNFPWAPTLLPLSNR